MLLWRFLCSDSNFVVVSQRWPASLHQYSAQYCWVTKCTLCYNGVQHCYIILPHYVLQQCFCVGFTVAVTSIATQVQCSVLLSYKVHTKLVVFNIVTSYCHIMYSNSDFVVVSLQQWPASLHQYSAQYHWVRKCTLSYSGVQCRCIVLPHHFSSNQCYDISVYCKSASVGVSLQQLPTSFISITAVFNITELQSAHSVKVVFNPALSVL